MKPKQPNVQNPTLMTEPRPEATTVRRLRLHLQPLEERVAPNAIWCD